jgi:hypothetical protein
MALTLKVDAPRNDTTVNNPVVEVNGRILGTDRASAKVTINDGNTPIKDDKFSASYTLAEGKNILDVVAASGAGARISEKVNVTYVKK